MLSLISGWPYTEFFIFNIIKGWKNSGPELLVAYIQSKLISDDHIQGWHCISKPDQQGPSGSIRLEVMYIQTQLMQYDVEDVAHVYWATV